MPCEIFPTRSCTITMYRVATGDEYTQNPHPFLSYSAESKGPPDLEPDQEYLGIELNLLLFVKQHKKS
jgi:hypothetical protein